MTLHLHSNTTKDVRNFWQLTAHHLLIYFHTLYQSMLQSIKREMTGWIWNLKQRLSWS